MPNWELNKLIIEATSLDVGQGQWLLEASALSQAIHDAVLGDPYVLDIVQRAVRAAAARAGGDLIAGTSPAADRVVHDLNTQGVEPSKALLFELVRVTGANLVRARREFRHINVVPAVFVDLNPSSRSSDVLSLGTIES